MDQVNVGIIGFGTVGSGTVEILLKNRDIISARIGAQIVIKKIADLDIASDRGLPISSDLLTTDPMEVILDPSVHIVVELIGGLTHAKDFILKAMEAGKHVVTANKALLAECGGEIYQAAEKYGVSLAFEASVGGGIPVIRSLREGLSANRIQTIMGILNGTSNYILTRMSQNGLPYGKAVEEALRLGYAEDPPTLDVDGTDAAHKLAILVSIVFGVPVPFHSIYREGIDRLTPEDIRFAAEFGYCLKLLAISRIQGETVEARVHPAMVPLDHIMANVNGVYNAIYLEGDFVGPNLYYGHGAGKKPTGSAVVADLMHLARQIRSGVGSLIPPLAHVRPNTGTHRRSTDRGTPDLVLLAVFRQRQSGCALKNLRHSRGERHQHLLGDPEGQRSGRIGSGGHADPRSQGKQCAKSAGANGATRRAHRQNHDRQGRRPQQGVGSKQ
jgi:homoserine dehydrogenase